MPPLDRREDARPPGPEQIDRTANRSNISAEIRRPFRLACSRFFIGVEPTRDTKSPPPVLRVVLSAQTRQSTNGCPWGALRDGLARALNSLSSENASHDVAGTLITAVAWWMAHTLKATVATLCRQSSGVLLSPPPAPHLSPLSRG